MAYQVSGTDTGLRPALRDRIIGRYIQIDLGCRRVLHPGKLLWLRAMGWMAPLILAVAMAFGPSMETISRMLPDNPAAQFVAHALGCLIILGAYALMVRIGEDRAPSDPSSRKALWPAVISTAPTGRTHGRTDQT